MRATLFKAIAIALGLMAMVIPSADARADLDSCVPALNTVLTEAPKEIRCSFSEPIVPAESMLAVFDANNNQVDNKDAKLDPTDYDGQTIVVSLNAAKLSNGVYKVQWVSKSKEDSNRAEGQWNFSINAGTTASSNTSGAPTTTSTQSPSTTTSTTPPQVPVAVTGPLRISPAAADAFGVTVQTIPANTAQWFRFEYDTNNSQSPRPNVTVRLLNGVTKGLGFEVWSPERLQGNWESNQPVGRGTQQVFSFCEDTTSATPPSEETPPGEEPPPGEEGPPGEEVHTASERTWIDLALANVAFVECPKFVTNDLTWTGGFGASGTYYVRLVNPNNAPIVPQMLISGVGLRECINANMGLPAWGKVPGAEEPFVHVQCLDVGPGLVASDQPPPASEDEGGDE